MPRHKHPPHPDTPSQLPTVEQWGTDSLNSEGYGTIVFPISFTRLKYTFVMHIGSAPVAWNLNEDPESIFANMTKQYIRGMSLNKDTATYAYAWLSIGF